MIYKYFDYASTTPVLDSFKEDSNKYLDMFGNPSNDNPLAFENRNIIEITKNNIRKSLNSKNNSDIIFTSGGSESNSMVILGWFLKNIKNKENLVFITTPIEHHSVLNCAGYLEKENVKVEYLKINDKGTVNKDYYEFILNKYSKENKNILVSIMWVNNEIGTIQNISILSYIAHKYKAKFHTDAVQAYGHIKIDASISDVDFLSLSGHKIGAVKGIGAVYIKNGFRNKISPIVFGGKQQYGIRGGTENTFGIASLNEAVKNIDISNENINKLYNIKKRIIEDLKQYGITFIVNGYTDLYNSSPNILNISFFGIYGESLMYCLSDLYHIIVSTGSACSDISEENHVLKEIDCPFDYKFGTIRISISKETTEEDINYLTESINKCILKLKNKF